MLRFLIPLLSLWLAVSPVYAGVNLAGDASSDYLTCGSDSAIDDFWPRTLYVVFRVDDLSIGRNLVNKYQGGSCNWSGWALSVRTDGRLAFFNTTTSSDYNAYWYSNTTTITTGEIYRVAVTYGRGSTSNDPIMSINGVSQSVTENNSPEGSMRSDGTCTFQIGADGANSFFSGYEFVGNIYEVAQWNSLTTQAPLDRLTAMGVKGAGYFTGFSALRQYYFLNEFADGTALDTSGSDYKNLAASHSNCNGVDADADSYNTAEEGLSYQ